MDPATGAIDSLLPKLEELLSTGKLRKSARKQVIFLQEKLTGMQLAFSDADPRILRIKELLRQVRDLSYGIEHVVDKFLARRLRAADPPAEDLHELIGEVRFKVAIANASRQFANDIGSYRGPIMELEEQYRSCLGPVEELVDLDGRVDVLVNKIQADPGRSNRPLMMASILGDEGVGKTTLVNQVYQRLNSCFECTAWVTLSLQPDIKNVLWSILCQISPTDDAGLWWMNVEQIIRKIREALTNKRYFIVVEDLWDIKSRETIKCALIENSNGSAVLMTSRKVSVGSCAAVNYRLKPLSENSSRKLFYRRLFGAGNSCPADLVGISEKIFKKCNGIPSAIINAAKLLAGTTKEDWHTVLDSSSSEDPYVVRSRNLSYTAVPEHLKSCLLYLSMFQQGYEISVDRLISGWIAEGYITEKSNINAQQQGEENLIELMERKLIEAVKVDADGKVLSCRVNDMGHDLIVSLSAEENWVTILDNREGQPLTQTVCRLAIQGNNADLPQDKLCSVRSLIVSGANLMNGESGSGNVMSLLPKFENLRVLELGGCDSLQNFHLDGMKDLHLLRYLVIGGNSLTHIPKYIGYLVFLQTLDLRETSLKELPETIVRARKLKCLRVNRHTKMPRGIGKMEDLQELGDMNISNAELLKELNCLTNLKILRIVIWAWDDGYNEALLSYLGSPSMENMKSLSIFTCCSLHIFKELKAEQAPQNLEKLEIKNSSFFSLPGWICSLENVSSLSIEVYKLSQKIIDTLGKLHNLLALSLKSKQAPEGNFSDGFPKLTSFHFVANAVGRIFGAGAMLDLKRLHLSFQASHTKDVYGGFDFGLGFLSSLEYARVEILCFNANLEMVKKAKDDIKKAIDSRRSSKKSEIHFDISNEIESGTRARFLDQAEHDIFQQNQNSSQLPPTDPSTSASHKHVSIQQNHHSSQLSPIDPSTSASHLSDNSQQDQFNLSPHLSSLQAGQGHLEGGVNTIMMKKTKGAIMKAINTGRSPGSEIRFDVSNEIESETHPCRLDQAEHDTIQRNQHSSQLPPIDSSPSASILSDNTQQDQSNLSPRLSSSQAGQGHLEGGVNTIESSPAQFCDECGCEYLRAKSKFCPGCGARRLNVQRREALEE